MRYDQKPDDSRRFVIRVKEKRLGENEEKQPNGTPGGTEKSVGHIETHKSTMKRAESETEATRWAIAYIKRLNLPVKRKVVNQYKDYIKMTYERGKRRGLKKRIKSKLYI